MGYTVYCCICGNDCYDKKNSIEYLLENDLNDNLLKKNDINNFIKNTEWSKNCYLLTVNGEVYKNMYEVGYAGVFKNNNDKKNTYPYYNTLPILNLYKINKNEIYYDFEFDSVFIHGDCYDYIHDKLGIYLTHNNIPSLYEDIYYNIYNIDYGDITQYQDQDLNLKDIIINKQIYMLESPLLNMKNSNRVNKILTQLKLTKSNMKKYINRPSPPISSAILPNNCILLGNDENIWINKNNKWQLLHKTIKILFVIDYDDYIKLLQTKKYDNTFFIIGKYYQQYDDPYVYNRFISIIINDNILNITILSTENNIKLMKKILINDKIKHDIIIL